MSPIFRIIPTIQKYDWGKQGSKSKVAQLAVASKLPDFQLDENTPYAELWMGTHLSSPSKVATSGDLLSNHLKENQGDIGAQIIDILRVSDGVLPFLFKVLSIEKALSIQTHPDKATAEKLHAEKPHIYRDGNHKPEMAIALTPFSALCGFLPIDRIVSYLEAVAEFAGLIPATVRQTFITSASSHAASSPETRMVLKGLFTSLMTTEESRFVPALEALVKRYKTGQVNATEKPLVDLVIRLHDQFPGDIGVFCPFVLNYVELAKGDAIFLGAGEPHAYVSGDIMECMATSDNVIRAGLTPKLRDIPNLVSSLTYEAADASKHVVKAAPFESCPHTRLFDPPIPEFSVLQAELGSGVEEVHRGLKGPSIAVVTGGSCKIEWSGGKLEATTGEVFFVAAETELKIVGNEENTEVFRAFVE
ncbi:mannose-6-phosphate isomerase [Thelephora ganbajun]|uniref:Mannose-6-phosphate isomerase n=1 Tax=Thelephora ganbajun TaxID=370292 RepID=A0ACB6ZNN1_THEGA|nr:mannose-6-phosphate isomerase [Thelephora ganbajun]